MKSKYSNIIWDWNGTLLDDVDFCLDIVNDILVSQGIDPMGVDDYKDVFGFPISEYYQKMGVDFSKISYEELTKVFIGRYNDGVESCSLHIEAMHTLGSLKGNGSRQFILTAAHKENVRALSHHYEINSFFTEIEGLDHYKGDSKISRGLDLVKSYNIDCRDTLFIGDTDHDYEVAVHLEIDCVLIANGHQSKDRLFREVGKNCVIIESMSDLPDVI